MTEEQVDEIYAGIVTILREAGLEWIVNEASLAIREGRIIESEISLESSTEERRARRKRQTVLGHVQQEWTPEERLALLLDAVESAVCGPVRMESELVKVLPELDGREIVFAPGGFGEELPGNLFRENLLRISAIEAGDPLYRPYEPYSVQVNREASERQRSAARLAQLLGGVRRELDANLD